MASFGKCGILLTLVGHENDCRVSGARAQFRANGGTGNEFTIVNTLLMTAPGRGNNLRAHELVRGYVDANGNVVIVMDNLTVDCG